MNNPETTTPNFPCWEASCHLKISLLCATTETVRENFRVRLSSCTEQARWDTSRRSMARPKKAKVDAAPLKCKDCQMLLKPSRMMKAMCCPLCGKAGGDLPAAPGQRMMEGPRPLRPFSCSLFQRIWTGAFHPALQQFRRSSTIDCENWTVLLCECCECPRPRSDSLLHFHRDTAILTTVSSPKSQVFNPAPEEEDQIKLGYHESQSAAWIE
eukprot:g56199.t1